RQEWFNAVTSLSGLILALPATAYLIWLGYQSNDAIKLASFSIYGATLIFLYFSSTLYHANTGPRRSLFRQLDHMAIYLLIAGTYTPLALLALQGPWGWGIMGGIWGLAAAGMTFDLLGGGRRRRAEVVVYLLMGWLIIIAIRPLTAAISMNGLLWLLAGGIFYTGGVPLFIMGRSLRFSHGIWHLFVILGSAAHFLTILLFLA
ncbi:MAG TPA: hemolysin III family protein, partial [Geobacterales bacterium]|nr:hemolysin III family protein [Geobacterales bacterium]